MAGDRIEMDLETLGGSVSLLDTTLLSSPISSFLLSGLLWSGLSLPSSLQLCRLPFFQNLMASATHKVVAQEGCFPLVEIQHTQRHDHHKPAEAPAPRWVAAPQNAPDLQQQQPASPSAAGTIPGFSQGGSRKPKHQQ